MSLAMLWMCGHDVLYRGSSSTMTVVSFFKIQKGRERSKSFFLHLRIIPRLQSYLKVAFLHQLIRASHHPA